MSTGKFSIKFAFITLVFLGAVFVLSGCTTPPPTETPIPTKSPVDGVDPIVSGDWLAENLGATNLRIVYVGTGRGAKSSYSKEHVPGSIFIDANDIMESPKTKGSSGIVASKAKFEKVMGDNGISSEDVVVVYGKYSGAWDAAWVARMWWTLKYYGHENIGILDGGIEKWTSDGRETQGGGSPTVAPAVYTAEGPDAGLRATGEYVLENLDNEGIVILDNRAKEEYDGKKKFGSERGGRIPGAVFLNWRDVMNPDYTFKSEEELKNMYAAIGVTSDKEIIIYCQGGIRVSHTLIALKEILGYENVRNYDGSWDEWANTKNTDGSYKYPIET